MTVTLEQAQAQLAGLVHQLSKGEEIIIVENDRIVARLIGERRSGGQRLGPGLCKGMISFKESPCKVGSARGKIQLASDFDAPIDELKEYME